VHIDHEDVNVRAQVHLISAYSAHADQQKILEWLGSGPTDPKRVVLNHGELGAMEVLAGHIRGKIGSEVIIPSPGETIEL
jgi:metallo-beta-lactamase family protein